MPRPPSRPVTIYDVAQHAGVSKSLVSLVLRGSPQVSPARREAVQASIAELGYRPSRAAASLAGRSNTIGVVIDEFSNLWFVDLLAGLRAGLDGTRFHVSVADTALNGHLAESPVQSFLAARVDGLVIAGEPGELGVAEELSVPTVVVGTRLHDVSGADHVIPDDRGGAAAAVEYLQQSGHERIAFIGGPTGPAAERERGYREAMTQAALRPMVVLAESTTEAGGLSAARALFVGAHGEADGGAGAGAGAHGGAGSGLHGGAGAGSSVTAIVAANDLLALGAWQALRETGRRVPQDVSLIGYDDSPLAATGLVQLTSVDPCNEEVGRRAAELLRSRIDDPARSPRRVTVEPRLVHRATTTRSG